MTMKKSIIILLLAFAALVSCQKEDENGDLGGFWKLQQIEMNETGSVIVTRNENRFWRVQLELIQIGEGKGRFQHAGDSLFVQLITIPDNPKDFGLYSPRDERFGVLHLDRNGMVLKSDSVTLTFKKF